MPDLSKKHLTSQALLILGSVIFTRGKEFLINTKGGKAYLAAINDRIPNRYPYRSHKLPHYRQAVHTNPDEIISLLKKDKKKTFKGSFDYQEPFPGKCKTNGGAKKGSDCVFPFFFAGRNRTYHGCTQDLEFGRKAQKFWCSTLVDSNGNHLTGNWGNCGVNCPRVKAEHDSSSCRTNKMGQNCVFPFTYDDFSYDGCILIDGRRKCLLHGHDKWGWCHIGCPKDEILGGENLDLNNLTGKLLIQSAVYLSIEREDNCADVLNSMYTEQKDLLKPELVENTENFQQLLAKTCSNAEYCKGNRQQLCGEYSVVKRISKEAWSTKADCMLRCSNPDALS